MNDIRQFVWVKNVIHKQRHRTFIYKIIIFIIKPILLLIFPD